MYDDVVFSQDHSRTSFRRRCPCPFRPQLGNSSWSPKYPKAGLQYDSTVQLTNPAKTGSQHATFDITINLSHPNGGGTWTFYRVDWAQSHTAGQPYPASGISVDKTGDTTARAHVFGPGSFTVNATVWWDWFAGGMHQMASEQLQIRCFAIGGPITVIADGITDIPTGQQVLTLHYYYDWPENPSYLTYFGYDPSVSVPEHAQKTPDGYAQGFNSQPDEPNCSMSYHWSVPTCLAIISGQGTNLIKVKARGTCDPFEGAKPTLSYVFTDPDGQQLQVDDDSDATPTSGSTVNKAKYRFACVAPATMSLVETIPHWYTTNPDGFDGFVDDYFYKVKDQASHFMQDIWVQERFPNGTPVMNSPYWDAVLDLPYPTEAQVNGTGTVWITDSDGVFRDPDSIGWICFVGPLPDLLTEVYGPAPHRYFAGNSDASPMATTGIMIMNAVFKIFVGSTNNE